MTKKKLLAVGQLLYSKLELYCYTNHKMYPKGSRAQILHVGVDAEFDFYGIQWEDGATMMIDVSAFEVA